MKFCSTDSSQKLDTIGNSMSAQSVISIDDTTKSEPTIGMHL